MKRIYKGNDIQFNVTLNKLPINFNLIQSITFNFYTLNKANCIIKTEADVDKNNVITIGWEELSKLEEGVMFYDYHLKVQDVTQADGTLDTVQNMMTNYYICTGKDNIDITGNTPSVTVVLDDALSLTSENGVKNKVITKALNEKTSAKLVTQEEYNNLTDEQKNSNTIYIISDAPTVDLNTKLDASTYEQDKATFATKNEIASKADKTYVDNLIGGVETKITEINGMI